MAGSAKVRMPFDIAIRKGGGMDYCIKGCDGPEWSALSLYCRVKGASYRQVIGVALSEWDIETRAANAVREAIGNDEVYDGTN